MDDPISKQFKPQNLEGKKMREIFIAIALAISATAAGQESIPTPAPAPAQGTWTPLGGEYYRGSNYVWRAYYNCSQWHYKQLYPVTALQPTPGTDQFYDDALKALTQQEREDSQRAFLESRFPGRAQQAGYSGQTTTGYSVYHQGVAPALVAGGQTIYGLAGYNATASPIDVTSLIHEAQRLADRTLGVAEMANTGAAGLVAQAVDGNSKAAQIEASARVAAAAIAAANPPITKTDVYKSEPTLATPPQPQPGLAQPRAELEQAPPAPKPSDGAAALRRSNGLLALNSCVKCHSGPAPKAGLVLTLHALEQLTAHDRDDLAVRIADRTDPSAAADKRMPKGGDPLPAKLREGLISLIVQN